MFLRLFVLSLLLLSLLLGTEDLDTSFGYKGKATTMCGGEDNGANSIAIQSDGKIVVAGYSDPGGFLVFAVARFDINGTLDNTFDSDGRVKTKIGFHGDAAYGVAIQSDGKIVVAGASNNGTDLDFAVVRYNINGALDSSFSSDGIVTTNIGNDDNAYSVAIQNNGKIVVAGSSYDGSDYNFALLRYNANGTLDSSFSSDGIVTTDVGPYGDTAYSVAIQSDGKIVVAGVSNNGTDLDFAVVRYNINGTLDSTFRSNGIVTTDVGGNSSTAYSVAIQSDGKIVVAGKSHNGNNNDFAVVRYNINGTLDTSFSSDGVVITDISYKDEVAHGIAIQNNGKIVMGGSIGNSDIVVARYNSDGILDSSFSSDGIIITDFGSRELGEAIAIQSDGKIIVAGKTILVLPDLIMQSCAIVRYNRDGSGVAIMSPTYYLLFH